MAIPRYGGGSPEHQARQAASRKQQAAARASRATAARTTVAPSPFKLKPFTRTFQTPARVPSGFAQARGANVARQSRIEGIYDEMLKSVGRGGAFEKAGLADIEEARVTGVGEETQSMISSGTFGTTTAAGIPGKHRKIATQARLKLEDVVAQRELGVKQQKAGFLERIEDTYPDYSQLLSSLAR